jgi:uncharacterized protein YfaS (alpha-2-macroglobulin family)
LDFELSGLQDRFYVKPALSAYLPKDSMNKKPSATRPGIVQKIVKSPVPGGPEKAQILVEGADELYRELRVENTLTDEKGKEVSLKQDAHVDVIVEAEPEATKPKAKTG